MNVRRSFGTSDKMLGQRTEMQEGTLLSEHLNLGNAWSKQTRTWWQHPCVYKFSRQPELLLRKNKLNKGWQVLHWTSESSKRAQVDNISRPQNNIIKHFLNQIKFFTIPSEAINFESIAAQQPRFSIGISPNYNVQWKGGQMQTQHPLQAS